MSQQQSTSFNENRSLSELTVICATVGQWKKLNQQPCGLILICQNWWWQTETIQNLEHHGSQIWGLFCVLNIGNKFCFNFAGNNCNELKTVSNRDLSNWSQYCHDALYTRSSRCKGTVRVTGHCGTAQCITGHHVKAQHITTLTMSGHNV
jgi:hypothetical protein